MRVILIFVIAIVVLLLWANGVFGAETRPSLLDLVPQKQQQQNAIYVLVDDTISKVHLIVAPKFRVSVPLRERQ